MDLVSIESQQEQNFVGQNMARAGVRWAVIGGGWSRDLNTHL